MHLPMVIAAFALALTLTTTPSTASGHIDRYARVIFNHGLPPMCTPGWYGRGIGLLATCALGGRMQIRFIDGYILPCALPGCRDHAPRIEAFLQRNGY